MEERMIVLLGVEEGRGKCGVRGWGVGVEL